MMGLVFSIFVGDPLSLLLANGFVELLSSTEARRLALLTCVYAALCIAAHKALLPLANRTKIASKSRNDWVNRLIAIFHAAVCGAAGAYMVCSEPQFAQMMSQVTRFASDVDTVHSGPSVVLRNVMPFTLGYMIYDCGLMAVDDELSTITVWLHHVVSIAVWTISYLSQTGCFYVVYLLATDLSTTLLHPVVFFIPKHDLFGGLPKAVVSAMLIIVFFLLRVLPSPMILWSLVASRRYWADADPVVTAIAIPSLFIPPFLFGFWFYLLISGAIKLLQKKAIVAEPQKNQLV